MVQMCARDVASFGSETAKVLCRQLGLPLPGRLVGPDAFGPGSGPVLLDSMQCWGSPQEVNDCHYTLNSADCGHETDVGLICNAPPGELACRLAAKQCSGRFIAPDAVDALRLCKQFMSATKNASCS